jgi:coenzyme F420-0:L-glutamate ligase/coenzyme F420-1:gamma-L-glutamate ligase
MRVFSLAGIPRIKKGDDPGEAIINALSKAGLSLQEGDIVVVAEKIVAKAEGRVVALRDVAPSRRAVELADETGKDPRLVELILRESVDVIKTGKNFLIVETHHGFVCANAGIDQSNVPRGYAKLLPRNPDDSAEDIRRKLEDHTGKRLGVIIADSFGRPFRRGSVGVAIGASGVVTLWDRRGEKDIYGRRLRVTRVGVADCIASAANLLLGEAGEETPVVVIRGLDFLGDGNAAELLRTRAEDVFR